MTDMAMTRAFALALLLASAAAPAQQATLPNEAVPALDLQRYSGQWHEIAHLPGPKENLGARLEQHGSLYRALRESYGIEITMVEDTVETVLADPHTANLLDVDTGLPLLLIHRTAFDADGRVVEWTRSAFRGDRFRFVARQHLDEAGTPRGGDTDLASVPATEVEVPEEM